jgi:hypothetical protein
MIDTRLATAYRKAYLAAFGSSHSSKKPLKEFIAGFVEDRLAEEIEFATNHIQNEPR